MKLKKVEKPEVKKSTPIKFKKQETPKAEEKVYTDLKSVMDYDKEFSMFFSGVENDTYFTGCYDMGIRDFLMSYHYLQKSKIPMHQKYDGLGIKFFIDSGAHTYQNDPKYQEYTIEHWEQHIKKYLSWVERNREFIFAIANCDFENLVGGEVVLEWNEKFFEPFMLRTGIPVCFVWHQDSGRTWEQYCQRYPYVGFSSVNTEGESIDMAEYVSTLKVAEKYNALVHGFGMTRTSMLPQLPFYSVDSTSWKAGFMYGQLAFWNGRKVSMVRKDSFEKAFTYIRKYDLTPPIDEGLIYDYYEPEVLRANVFAYMKAVEFIRNALKKRTYWKKPKAEVRTESDLGNIEYPTPEWLGTPFDDRDRVEEFAASLNISMEIPRRDTATLIEDMTCFMNWDREEYQDFIQKTYTPEVIKSLHDSFVNKIVSSDEDRIKDLILFYKDNLLGKDTTLLYLGTNFDRTVKERDSYVEDEEYDYEDVSEMEMNNFMAKYLPVPKEGEESGAPEIDSLDEEIFREEGIIPVRDSKGKFLKGQKKVARPKKLYSNKYPKLACDTCVNAQTCPEYKSGYVCAFNKMFDRYDTRDLGDIVQAMQGIASYSLVRLQRAMLSETLNGGIPDPTVTNLMNQSISLMSQMQRLYETGSPEIIRQTKVVRMDGTQETITQVSNPQAGGILERIFGDMGREKSEPEEIVVPPDNIKEVEE